MHDLTRPVVLLKELRLFGASLSTICHSPYCCNVFILLTFSMVDTIRISSPAVLKTADAMQYPFNDIILCQYLVWLILDISLIRLN